MAYNPDLPAGTRLRRTGPVIAASSWARSPAGTTRPSPPSTPGSASRTSRSPSCTAPMAAAPPTSSATTFQRRPHLGDQVRPRQNPELAGRGGGRRQRQCHPTVYRTPPPSATSSRPTPGPGGAAAPAIAEPDWELPPPVQPDHHRRQPPKNHALRPDRRFHRQPARRKQLPHQRLQLGDDLHPPARPEPGQGLVNMLDWLTHNGQAYAAANLFRTPATPGILQRLAPHHAPANPHPTQPATACWANP